jgi:hypothetical protein
LRLPWKTVQPEVHPVSGGDWARWYPLRELAKMYGVPLHRIEIQEKRGRIRFERTPGRGSIIVRRARPRDLLDLPLYGFTDVARALGCSSSSIRRRSSAGTLTFELVQPDKVPRMFARELCRHMAMADTGRPARDLPPVLRKIRPAPPTGLRVWLELIRIDEQRSAHDADMPDASPIPLEDTFDAAQTMGGIARLFRVSNWLLKEQARRGFVELRWSKRGYTARPSLFLDAPLYRASAAARLLGVSTRTVFDWAAKGRIGLRHYPGLVKRRTTPREVALCLAFRPRRKKGRRKTLPMLGPVVPSGEKPHGRFCWTVRNRRLEPLRGTGWRQHHTLRELARVLGIGVRRVQRLVDARILPVLRTGVNGTRKARPLDLIDFPLYRRGEVAAVLGVHRSTISRWEREGRIRMCSEPGGCHPRLSPRELATFVLNERRRAAHKLAK